MSESDVRQTSAMVVPDRTRVIAILGTSFSGSTLLNLILGAHPQIYAGGELSALILNRGDLSIASCTACGNSCAYWTDATKAEVTRANVYRVVERTFGKRVIVDSSKSESWFRDVLASSEHREIAPTYLLVVKHPIRYLSSCLANMGVPRRHGGIRGALNRFRSASMRWTYLEELLEQLDWFYKPYLSRAHTSDSEVVRIVHYERMVADQETAVAPILRSIGLSYDRQMDDFFRLAYHQIGGNAGPLFQLGHGWPDASKVEHHRKAFYERGPGLRIDDKYKDVLSPRELSRLLKHPILRRLCDTLGYGHGTMPFPIN